jgi:two-component system sensor histidine kinase TctE
MGRHAKSLTVQLGVRLSVLQIVILVATIAALTWSILNTRAAYIDEDLARGIARAVTVDDGVMHLHADGDMRAVLEGAPHIWFAVEDEQSHRLSHGAVPEAYGSLVKSLSTLEASEVHTTNAPYELAMRVNVENTPHGRIHVIVGGAPVLGLALVFFKISVYLGTRIGLPLVLVTLVAVPWLIHRSMAGVGKVADQAQHINIDERGAQLEAAAVPRELQPLVRAFNLALERLGEGYDARDRFLADAAHELRAPIAILEARLDTLPPGEARTRLLTDLARLANIAEQLLDLQRLGKQVTEFEPLDLVTLVREVSADVAPLVLDAGYELAMDAPSHAVVVTGDRLSLSRAVTNLLQNAIAHAGGKGLIHVAVMANGVFEISDEGPGIPEAERAKIFTPFYRLRPSSVGTGLGLHLVQEIVARHGGHIRVMDAPGGGARFSVRLPVSS